MADRDDVQKLGLDASQFNSELDEWLKRVGDASKGTQNWTSLMARFNDEGDLAGATMSFMADAANKVSVGFRNIEGHMEASTLTIRKNAQAMRENAAAVDEYLANAVGLASTTASDEQLRSIQAQMQAEKQLADYRGALYKSGLKDEENNIKDKLSLNQAATKTRADIYKAMVADEIKAEEQSRSELQRAVTDKIQVERTAAKTRADIYKAMMADRAKTEREAARASETQLANQRANDRAAARAGASLGSGNFSFTSLGSALSAPGAGIATNFALGAGVGAAAAALDGLVSGLKAGTERAVEFQLQVARIRAIQTGAAQSSQEWTATLQRMSVAYNIPTIEVAQAAYKGLSTQLVKSTTDTRLLEESLKLSKVTGADAAVTMQAMSAVINSYGLSADSATSVSQTLFDAVRLGNINMSELGNSIGRVTALSAPMGVKLKEVVAAVEVLRSKGVSTDQAMAGLSQLLAEFEHPSKAAQEAFQGMGVASGQQAIAVFGLVGALQKLNEQTIKQGHSIDDLFPNIRGLRTDFLLTADAVKSYNEKLAAAASGTNSLNGAVEKVTSAPGQEFKALLQSWNVELEKMGVDLLKAGDAIARFWTMSNGKKVKNPDSPFSDIKNFPGFDPNGDPNKVTPFKIHSPEVEKAQEEAAQRQSSLNKETTDKFQSEMQRRLTIAQEAMAKRNALEKSELDALGENGKSYIEELKRRTEGTRQELFNQKDAFEKNKFERSLRAAGTPQKQQELIENRLKLLNSQEEGKFSELQGLHGKAFLESKDPEEIKRIQQEILDIKTKQVDKLQEEVTKGLASKSKLQDAEDDLTKEFNKQFELNSTINQLFDERAKKAQALDTRSRQETADTKRLPELQDIIQKGQATQEQVVELAQILQRLEGGSQTGKLEWVGGSKAQSLRLQDAQDRQAVHDDIIRSLNVSQTAAEHQSAAIERLRPAQDALISQTYAVADAFVQAQHLIVSAAEKLGAGVSSTKGSLPGAQFMYPAPIGSFAEGGMATSDKVPAMLTQGEFVVNRAASAMFYPLLKSINDRSIRGYAEGGSVTTMGDVNITVRGGETSQQTLSEIARGLQKAIRRGTFKP